MDADDLEPATEPMYIVDESPPSVLTVDEVAALLRVNRKTVYEALARGEIPARRIGTTYRISRAAVVDWLRGQDRVAGARRKK